MHIEKKVYFSQSLLLTALLGQLILPSRAKAAPQGEKSSPPRTAAHASAVAWARGAAIPGQVAVALPSKSEPTAGPGCEQVCAQACASPEPALAVLRMGRVADAVDSLRACQGGCPQVACQLTLLYHAAEPDALKEHVDNKQIRKDSQQCRELLTPAAGKQAGPCAVTAGDKSLTKEVNEVWRMAHRPIWAGYGLLATGAALTLTSSILMGLAANNRLPLPGDCGWYSGVSGDPCIADFANSGTRAALGIPLAVGLGGMAAGAALLIKY